MITSKELKRRSRAVLEGKYFIAASLTTSLMLFSFAMSYLLQLTGFSQSDKLMYQAFSWILWAIMMLLGALLEIGLIKFLYAVSRGEQVLQPGVLFYAFKNQPDTFILTCGFRYLITLIWFVPALLKFLQLPMETMEFAELPGALLPVLGLVLAGAVPAVLFALPFCLTNYILLDDPYCSATEALRTSFALTKGRRKRILFLWLSFLPMLLLCIGSYGLGFLWVRPYYHTTMSQFYIELTGKNYAEETTADSDNYNFS